MARIRSIKPEIRRSLVVSSWPYPVRWTFVGLPGYLDDSGRGHDNTSLIKAELYPLDDDMTTKKLNTHLQRIADTGPLCRYEVAGQRYLHITTWAEHQRVNRPSPSRIPPCPLHENGSEGSVRTHGTRMEGSLPRAQARVPAEQGAGSREQGREQGAREAEPTRQRVNGTDPDTIPAVPAGEHTHPTADQLLDRTGPFVAKIADVLRPIVAELVDGGIPHDAIERGLAVWKTRRAGPRLLVHLVQDELTPAQQQDPRFAGLLADARSSA